VHTIEGSIDGLLSKALDCMTLEIRCGSVVLQILELLNTMYALEAFTLLCSTVKEVILAFIIISDLDIRFEEAIYRRAPSFAESFCKGESVQGRNDGCKLHTELSTVTFLIVLRFWFLPVTCTSING